MGICHYSQADYVNITLNMSLISEYCFLHIINAVLEKGEVYKVKIASSSYFQIVTYTFEVLWSKQLDKGIVYIC